MENFDKYCLELREYANNLNNKRQDYEHIINEDDEFNKNMYRLLDRVLIEENDLFDALGEDELIKYEKWLDNGRF